MHDDAFTKLLSSDIDGNFALKGILDQLAIKAASLIGEKKNAMMVSKLR